MIQLVVEEVFLDLYENDLPKITLQFDSFETFQPVSSHSQTFRVPATDNNYQFFKTAFDVNGYDFDVTTRKEAQILVDGNEIVSGELRLTKIYNREDKASDYEVVFFGEVRDLATKLGNKNLNELDLSELDHSMSMLNVTTSWLAYPTVKDRFNNNYTSTLTTGFKDGNVLYPLVDFGNDYDPDELTENIAISVGSSKHITQGDLSIVPNAERIWADRFKPMIRAKYLLDKIFEEAGFTYTSNFLTAALNPFQRLYVSAWGNDDSIYNTPKSRDTLVRVENPYFAGNLGFVRFLLEEYDYGDAWSINTYNSNITGTVNINFKVQVIGSKNPGLGAIRLKRNAVTIASVTIPAPDSNFVAYFDETIACSDTDNIRVEFDGPNIFIESGYLDATAPGEIVTVIEEDYKQIDFLRDVFTFAKLVLIPDSTQPGNFIIEPWSVYIGSGRLRDWSSKLDASKDIEIKPIFLDQSAQITFTTEDEGDWLNDLNKKTFKENFGELKVTPDNDLLKGEKNVKLKIASTPVTEIQGASTNTGTGALVGRDNMVIPHIYSLEAGETRALRKPIKPKTRFLFYNGMKYTGRTFNGLNSATDTSAPWYWRTDDPAVGAFSELFPQATPYQYTFNEIDYNPSIPSLNLTWQAENGYLRFGQLSPGYSMYDLYWGNYIKLLYDKYSRRVTANFILSADDLFDFEFKDVIFVKDTYYFVEAIKGVQFGERTSVKVDLIKLIDYNPDQGGFVPPFEGLVWQDVNINWQAISDNWGAF